MAAKATPDVLGLGMGLTSWVFPDIHIVIKVGLTVLVMVIVIFLKMDKAKQTSTLNAMGKFTESYLMPGLGGGLRALFFALIGIIVADLIFNIHLIDQKDYYKFDNNTSYSTVSSIKFFLHTLGNLTRTGNIILIIAVCWGAVKKINDIPKEQKGSV